MIDSQNGVYVDNARFRELVQKCDGREGWNGCIKGYRNAGKHVLSSEGYDNLVELSNIVLDEVIYKQISQAVKARDVRTISNIMSMSSVFYKQ